MVINNISINSEIIKMETFDFPESEILLVNCEGEYYYGAFCLFRLLIVRTNGSVDHLRPQKCNNFPYFPFSLEDHNPFWAFVVW